MDGGPQVDTKGAEETADNYLDMRFNVFGKGATQRRIEEAIRRGVGVHEASWPAPPEGAEAGREMAEAILEWVREAMGEMRRPYGIDYVALALACRSPEGRVVCSNSLGVQRPAVFYSAEGVASIEAFLADVAAVPEGRRGEIAGALLSVGDLAFELGMPAAA